MSQVDLWSHTQIEFKGENAGFNPNPLMWTEADFDGKGGTPTSANLLEYMADYLMDERGLKYAKSRYVKLRNIGISSLPHDYLINKISKLLKAAISDFIIRHTIGTIASCGMIGEIMTNYLVIVWNNTISTKPMDEDTQKNTFGKKFEKLNQYDKIEKLRKLNVVTFPTSIFLHKIRSIRNTYLHNNKTDDITDVDAEKMFYYVNEMLKNTLQFEIRDKKLWINKQVGEYIQSRSFRKQTNSP